MSSLYGQLLEQNAKLMAQIADLEAALHDLASPPPAVVSSREELAEGEDGALAASVEEIERQISLVRSALLRCARLADPPREEQLNASRLFSSHRSASMDSVAKSLFSAPLMSSSQSPRRSDMDKEAKRLFSGALPALTVRDVLSELIDEECRVEELRLALFEATQAHSRETHSREQRWRQLTAMLHAEEKAARRADELLRQMTRAVPPA